MIEKLLKIKAEYEALNQKLSDPATVSNPKELQSLGRRESQLRPVAALIDQVQACLKGITDSTHLLETEKDPELLALAKEELTAFKERKTTFEEELKVALIPKDPNDEKSVILEIRAGTGGEEAALFAAELMRMYMRYADSLRYKTELISRSDAEAGGIKEVIFRVIGTGAYSHLKYESGVHRVQRVPVTESLGRIHTSTATVAVLPEAEEVDIKISDQDIRIDVFRAGGHGGQSVNTTDSAVRITHLSTGLIVICQDEKSQLKNKQKAMAVLRSRLYKQEEDRLRQERGEQRLSQIGTGERNEKIRTYNFPQDRLTDHRVHKNWSNLPAIMDGKIDEITHELALDDQAKKLAVNE